MAQLAIKGHLTRGEEVIRILEMLGGINEAEYRGKQKLAYYFINNNYIDWYRQGTIESDFIILTLEEFLEKFPYKVGDKVHNIIYNEYQIITDLFWDSQENEVIYQTNSDEYLYVNYIQPYKKETMENKGTLVEIDLTREESKAEEIEVILGDYEFVLKDGKTYFVKKKPEYPKTFIECCDILYPNENFQTVSQPIKGHNGKKLFILQKLLICRDAYWKIAGEQMGLGEPWKPAWNGSESCYCIFCDNGEILEDEVSYGNTILAFPTSEMRDAFYENFKELIEECKEFL